jgi:hypothetical protein
MKKYVLSIFLALVMVLALAFPALAATTADVTVTYTPQYIAIADNVTAYDFGAVGASANYSTTTTYVGITNTSSVQTDITIGVTGNTWTGGTAHTHSDTAEPGADTVALWANRGGSWGTGDIIVKYDTPNYIYENCPATTNFNYGLRLGTPTSTTDGVEKTNTVRVSAAAG